MKPRLKMVICAALAAVALAGAVTAGASAVLRGGTGQRAGEAGGGFVLRESDGHVAIYYADFDRTPAIVTEIEVRLLPSADRALLAGGLPVETREELMILLEDLGS